MKDFEYWQRQDEQSLFHDIDKERPEQRRLAGKLAVIGGSGAMFFTIAKMSALAVEAGIGEVRTVLPQSLEKKLPKGNIDLVYAEASKSGSFAKGALKTFEVVTDWADLVLVGGDLGRSSETASLMGEYLRKVEKPLILTRDAVDVAIVDAGDWINKRDLVLIVTMAQLQKILRSIYYPRMVTLTMPLNQLIELLHKLTLSYGLTLMTFHSGQLVVAVAGQVVTMPIEKTSWNPINLWSGDAAVRIAQLKLWNSSKNYLNIVAEAWL